MARQEGAGHNHQQYLRLATLQAGNDLISNAIAELPIFAHYSFDLETLYASVDGQKFGVARPTVKVRHSRKYFGRGKGVVAYTLLCNHVPLQGWLIGAHEFEAHHVFDIWYRNTSDIAPTAITGDMHSLNKVNFAILDWFGPRYEPRFTDLDKQLGEIHCASDPAQYAHCLVKPAALIGRTITYPVHAIEAASTISCRTAGSPRTNQDRPWPLALVKCGTASCLRTDYQGSRLRANSGAAVVLRHLGHGRPGGTGQAAPRIEVTDGKLAAAFVVSRAITCKGTRIGGEVAEALAGYELPILEFRITQRVMLPRHNGRRHDRS